MLNISKLYSIKIHKTYDFGTVYVRFRTALELKKMLMKNEQYDPLGFSSNRIIEYLKFLVGFTPYK